MNQEDEKFVIKGYSTNEPYKFSILILLSMLYVTCKLSCNPMFFRQAAFLIPMLDYKIKINCSSLIFPAIYIISDVITYLTSRKSAICVILFGILCDGVFSYSTSYVASLDIPSISSVNQITILNAVNHVSYQMWLLYYSGVFAAMIAAIGEVILFSFLFKKVNSFFVSTTISSGITPLKFFSKNFKSVYSLSVLGKSSTI